jgi:ectoine hydroxylase-related dioxygenase (phytanoyl-CoA dioxygenase family)
MDHPDRPRIHRLAAAQVAAFRQDGFLVIDGVFGLDEVERWRAVAETDSSVIRHREASSTTHHLGLTERHPDFLALARDPRLIALLEPLIGADIVLMHSKLAAKPLVSGAGPFAWHQDGAYYPHTNTDVPTVMVMLDDATPENGCMRMVRGSHRLGYLDHADEDGYFSGQCRRALWEERPQDVVDITPRAGGISIHHLLMLHGSPANRSGRPRRGLVYSYRAADAMQLGDQIWPETGLVVSGALRGRVRCDPLPILLPRFHPGIRDGEHGSAWNQVGPFARTQNRATGLSESGAPA